MPKVTERKEPLDKRQSRSYLKRLRAAEARRRYELFQEECLLHNQLADFWDQRFEKSSHHTDHMNQLLRAT